jgi:integrase
MFRYTIHCWRFCSPGAKDCPPTKEGWVFANPITSRPYFPTEIQKRHLKPLGIKLGSGANRLAHVPPHVPFVAGRDRSADESAAGTHATRINPDDDERLWTGNAGIEDGKRMGKSWTMVLKPMKASA